MPSNGWTSEQWQNARIIYQVGVQMGMSMRDIQIALITAITESGLKNVNYGDRDSLGLFQQRPSQGWGTPSQVTDPVYASRKFYSALKGLGQKRYQMGMGEAAQAVQRSAFPDRYATHIQQVRNMWPNLSGGSAKPVSMGSSLNDSGLGGGAVPGAPAPSGPTLDQVLADSYQRYGNTAPTPDYYSVLGANYQSVLGAPNPFVDTSQGFGAQTADMPAWASPLNSSTFQTIQDQAAAGNIGMSYGKGVDGWRKAVIEAARSAIGTPYVWGGNSLDGGVDCSGLVQQAFAKAGIHLPRVSYAQANFGTRVGIGALRPGDLVAWDNSSRNNGADHIAIYIGNGQIIEAPRPGLSVRIRKLGGNEGAWGVRIHR